MPKPEITAHRSIPPRILLIDDDEAILRFERSAIEGAELGVVLTCRDSREALKTVEREEASLVVLDLGMPHIGGEEILSDLLDWHPDLPIIVATGEHDLAAAVRCMKTGASDYLTKPFSAEQLVAAIEAVASRAAVDDEMARYREVALPFQTLHHAEAFAEICTSDPKMIEMFRQVESVAKGSQPVFIWGETGTGKELVARALHDVSGRKGPFVAVNVAGLDDTLLSDALFGHTKGAFTGADSDRKGMIEVAGDGTLFLDEIGDLAEASQVKLLRLLQEQEYYRVGDDRPRALTARLVTATHRPPESLRKDLYYRLRSYRVDIPPLRERLGDLPILIEHFLRHAARDLGKRKPAVPSELFAYLSNHDYPGNVRELRSMVFDAMARHGQGVMRLAPFLDHIHSCRNDRRGLPPGLGDSGSEAHPPREGVIFPHPLPTLRDIEQAAIVEAMQRTEGNRTAAARLLGVSRPTIARHIERAP